MMFNPQVENIWLCKEDKINYYKNELKRVLKLPENKRFKDDENTPRIMRSVKEKIKFNINLRVKELENGL